MTTHPDQRTWPRRCTGCGAAIASCEERRMLSGRPCCASCAHTDAEGITP